MQQRDPHCAVQPPSSVHTQFTTPSSIADVEGWLVRLACINSACVCLNPASASPLITNPRSCVFVQRSYGGMKDEDRIFTNLYGRHDWRLKGALSRVRRGCSV